MAWDNRRRGDSLTAEEKAPLKTVAVQTLRDSQARVESRASVWSAVTSAPLSHGVERSQACGLYLPPRKERR